MLCCEEVDGAIYCDLILTEKEIFEIKDRVMIQGKSLLEDKVFYLGVIMIDSKKDMRNDRIYFDNEEKIDD